MIALRISKKLSLVVIPCVVALFFVGCSTDKPQLKPQVQSHVATTIQDSSIRANSQLKNITQIAFFQGFVDKNLVEFKINHQGKDTIRVFNVGKDIVLFLSKQKQDGRTKLTITYQESKDGISSPVLLKVVQA
ncbi:hypothetical protein PP175_28050 (plasmid) [Aneurinibacillus sp. Ricciae_BoGa-3]|uniref:hypothetical protein n=1 Tax=Aneurinibacillus sp. Ricciae_BoGa-3 TaxID=3022697 RepID=UPI0023414A61|nr:hypothetical protein [Aneurinibacillus sp. Ricciae_BoGa-3]WCK57045.1 hypothetical protein PP175_28050 [Aneurinibacillus sp. Ricciae_BoGa-3]